MVVPKIMYTSRVMATAKKALEVLIEKALLRPKTIK
jgi:hypothetical protein